MKIGLIDVDGHNFPNLALMKISAYHKAKGDEVEWVNPLFAPTYDKVYKSKIFTFTQDDSTPFECEVIKGGTGYDIKSKLPDDIEAIKAPDYSIYPQYNYSIQFLSRGCIRHCPFCLVHDKEGYITPCEPMELNPKGKWIEVLDNNFFANPNWREAVKYLNSTGQPVNLHGVDVRIMDEEQAEALNSMKLQSKIHIAWDLPQIDLTDRLKAMLKHIKPYKIRCYVLVGFNSTIEQDLFRIETLKQLGINPFVMKYRDFENKTKPSQYCKDIARWVNKLIYIACKFEDYEPRKGFKCREYLK